MSIALRRKRGSVVGAMWDCPSRGFLEKEAQKRGGEIKAHLYIGIASESMKKWTDYHLGGTQRMLRERTAILALDALRKELSKMTKA